MKLITAIIREVQLDKVHEALIEADIKRITVSRVSGHGQQRVEELHRGQIVVPDLIPKIKIEIAVNDAFVEITVNAILKAARTNGAEGTVGDGKIFISPWRSASGSAREREVAQPSEAAGTTGTVLSGKCPPADAIVAGRAPSSQIWKEDKFIWEKFPYLHPERLTISYLYENQTFSASGDGICPDSRRIPNYLHHSSCKNSRWSGDDLSI